MEKQYVQQRDAHAAYWKAHCIGRAVEARNRARQHALDGFPSTARSAREHMRFYARLARDT